MSSFRYTEIQRRRAVAWAVALTAHAPLAPRRYERSLLQQLQYGQLALDEMLHLLDTGIYQIVYRSEVAQPMQEKQLRELLIQSRYYNQQHHITGLLLYSEGHFVQVLEGPEQAVRALYARIQQDSRHQKILTIGEGLEPKRRFGEWAMAFGQVAKPSLDVVLNANPDKDVVPDVNERHIQALLQAFGVDQVEPVETYA